MSATTVRLPEEKLRNIRVIAGYENRPVSKIFEEFADEYIGRHRETLELAGIPGFMDTCRKGVEEIRSGGGKDIKDLEKPPGTSNS
jgi:hypothetical protein